MSECCICLQSMDYCKSCERCLEESCYKCTILNDGKCCHCGYIMDDVEREIQMQVHALHEHIVKQNATRKHEVIKQCPNCKTWIERNSDDCNQMYCVICKTVWIWDTLEIVTSVLDIHNPLFYKRVESSIVESSIVESSNRGVMKCLKALNEENAKYMSDTFVYRLLFATEQITFDEFKAMIRERYTTFIKHIKLKEILETDCDNVKIKELNDKWNVTNEKVHLPYV